MKKNILSRLRQILILVILTLFSLLLAAAGSLALSVTLPLQHPILPQNGYEEIHFPAANGQTMRGWYLPPQNGAVILLLHPYYGDRRASLPIAEMLRPYGYGLLMYDQRASGESEGDTRSLGWLDIADLPQAAAFVHNRAPQAALGAWGCSVGGIIALGGAAQTPLLQAVAADAPSPLTWAEYQPPFRLQDPLTPAIYALYYPLVALRAGTFPPFSVHQTLQRYAPRPLLLLSTGSGAEAERIRAYQALAGAQATHRNFPQSSHCAAPHTNPAEYQTALVEFFQHTLLPKGKPTP
jgi:hypothetical protein